MRSKKSEGKSSKKRSRSWLRPIRAAKCALWYLVSWASSRDTAAYRGLLPVLLLLGSIAGIVINGWRKEPAVTIQTMADLVDEVVRRGDVENVEAAAGIASPFMKRDASLMPTQLSPMTAMMIKKLALRDVRNARWRFLLAMQLEQQHRLGQARQMMRSIAPMEGRGFAPAYAWLAWDTISKSRIHEHQDKLGLILDLQKASDWSGSAPALFGVLAELLDSEGRVDDAIAALEQPAKSDAEIAVMLMTICHKHGRTQTMEATAQQSLAFGKSRVSSPEATDQDFTNFATLCVMQQDFSQALRVTDEGLVKFPHSKSLARARSEAFRVQYILSHKEVDGNVQRDVESLQQALRADPTNEMAIDEVARLQALGVSTTPEMNQALDRQVAEGKASATTHMLLSEIAAREQGPAASVPHLEAALRSSPNSFAVLNNLAVTLARLSADHLPRSRELIDRAITLAGDNAELFDSQGQIRMIDRDYYGAVSSFENAIRVDNQRLQTRQRLVKAYEEAGLTEMAEIQRTRIEELTPKKSAEGR